MVLALVGVLAPAALAMGASPMHACCMRKGMHCHTPHEAQFQTPGCCGHDCCRSLTVSQFAEHSPAISHVAALAAVSASVDMLAVHPSTDRDASHSGRAPPISFL
jgi:hypothetical protein